MLFWQRFGWVLMLVSISFLGCRQERAVPTPPTADSDEPRQVLRQSVQALDRVDSVSYDFTWGGSENPTGWVTGHTRMRRITDVNDSWIRVEGVIHAQPEFGVERSEFRYATDGEHAWAEDRPQAGVARAPVDDGANALATRAVYGFLPEFIESRPFWKELETRAEMRLLEPETVDGVLCDVVEVRAYPEIGPPSDVVWSNARDDRLPRRGRWPGASGGATMVFTITDLMLEEPIARAEFRLESDDLVEAAAGSGVGSPAPGFELETPDGETIRLADLAGQVVVMDFWNTWCYLCRTIAPATHQLAADLADKPVQFLGINVFETGDPVAYWRQAGDPYPLLLDGDEVARSLDVPWQPGAVVIGPEGSILYRELGASPDRAAKIRRAIERGLADL